MFDPHLIRNDPAKVRAGLERREILAELGGLIDRGAELDRERRAVIQAAEERKARRNAISQEVARRKRGGETADEQIAEGRAVGDEVAKLESDLHRVEADLEALFLQMPNIPLPDVPAGGADKNVVVRAWGTPSVAQGVRPHWEIGEALGLLDLQRGAKVSGSGFVVFRRNGARLVRALMNLMLDLHGERHGYEEVWVPKVVTRQTMTGTGQLPKFEDDLYRLRDEDLFLIPTAEVPVTNLLRDEMLLESALPIQFAAFTPCFRREAGAHGKDTRGLLRVHEFDKVELVRFTTPERSADELELLVSHAETVLQHLELPYRVKLLAAGDTSFASAKTYDLEAWAPGVGQWLEVSSCSSFTDFQARRANIRYRPASGGKPSFVHTLNGSGVAFARTIACLLEQHQRPDGTVVVPEALRPYLRADILH